MLEQKILPALPSPRVSRAPCLGPGTEASVHFLLFPGCQFTCEGDRFLQPGGVFKVCTVPVSEAPSFETLSCFHQGKEVKLGC